MPLTLWENSALLPTLLSWVSLIWGSSDTYTWLDSGYTFLPTTEEIYCCVLLRISPRRAEISVCGTNKPSVGRLIKTCKYPSSYIVYLRFSTLCSFFTNLPYEEIIRLDLVISKPQSKWKHGDFDTLLVQSSFMQTPFITCILRYRKEKTLSAESAVDCHCSVVIWPMQNFSIALSLNFWRQMGWNM